MSLKSVNRTVSPKTRALRAYRAQVRQLLKKTFGLTEGEMVRQDRVWNNWIGVLEENQKHTPFHDHTASGESSPLRVLLGNGNILDPFRARVIAVLSAPTIAQSPFPYSVAHPQWRATRGYAKMWLAPFGAPLIENVLTFSEKLQQFFWNLLEINLKAVNWKQPRDQESPSVVEESDRNKAYNKLILKALEVLPADSEQAERFFQYYYMTVPGCQSPLWLSNGDFYSSFRALLGARVAESWKVRADQFQRQEVVKQQSAQGGEGRQPLRSYTSEIERTFEGSMEISPDLFASQVDWALQQLRGATTPLFRYDSWKQVLGLLRDEKYQETSYRFVRHMVFCQQAGHSFQVYGDTELEVKRALATFGAADQELARELERALRDYENRLSRWQQEQLSESRAVAAMYE